MKKYLIPAFVLALIGSAYFGIQKAKANPTYIISPYNCNSGYSTSTINFMTPGTGTTTVLCDTGQSQNNGNNDVYIADDVSLALQVWASTTNQTVSVLPQASQDGIDWYSVMTQVTANATTTTFTPITYQIALATSTGYFTGNSNLSRVNVILPYMNPSARYVRFLVYDPIGGGGNLSVWGDVLAQKQTVQSY